MVIKVLHGNHTLHEADLYVSLLPPASEVIAGKTGSDNFDVVGEVAEMHWVHESARVPRPPQVLLRSLLEFSIERLEKMSAELPAAVQLAQ